MIEKWDLRFLELAKLVASWSKDPSTKTGAVICDSDKRIVSVGFNGLPKGIEDKEERLNNREIKYEMVAHCEMNALAFAKGSCKGCTLYTFPFMSCNRCAVMVIQYGIKRCVAPVNDNPRWAKSFELSREMFREAGVQLDLGFLPE